MDIKPNENRNANNEYRDVNNEYRNANNEYRNVNKETMFGKRHNKTMLLGFTAFFAIIVIASCIMFLVAFIAERLPEAVDHIPERMISQEKFDYARGLGFQFQIAVDGVREINPFHAGSVTNPHDIRFDPFYDELIFVHSEADAADFPDNVIAAWPRGDYIEEMVARINWTINRNEEDLSFPILRTDESGNYLIRTTSLHRPVITSLEEFGLAYPIQASDLFDNWEGVYELLMTFTGAERDSIRRFGQGANRPPAE